MTSYLPKAPPPETITLGIRISVYEFRGDINIQTITGTFHFLCFLRLGDEQCLGVNRKEKTD